MGRDGEGGCRQKGVYLRGVPSHGLEDGVWKKRGNNSTRYRNCIFIVKDVSCLFFSFFFVFGDPVP